MNERIKELAEQAEDPEHGFIIPEKFAELIVRECAAFIDSAFDIDAHSGEVVAWADGGKLKKHFGVEE